MSRSLEQRKSYHPDLQYIRRTRDALSNDDRYPSDIRTTMVSMFDLIIASFHIVGIDGCVTKQNDLNDAWMILSKKVDALAASCRQRDTDQKSVT